MDADIKEELEFIKQEPEFIKQEDDFPFTVIAVKIGENGTIEELNKNPYCEANCSSDPQTLLNNYNKREDSSETDNSEDWNEISKSPVNSISTSIEPKNKRKKKVQGPHKCAYCEKGFCNATILKNHIMTHTGEKPFECSVCFKKCNQKSNLSTHMKVHASFFQTHSTDKPFSCSDCKISYNSKRNYMKHMRTHKEGEKQSTESSSGLKEKSNLKQSLGQRVQSYTKVKTFQCSDCQKEFSSEHSLKSHVTLHKRRKHKFSCDECGVGFSEKQWLERHMEIHNEERPFSCDICKKRFAKSEIYKTHMRIHSGERPFSCTICNKTFRYRSNLRTHTKTHTGEKPFSCPVCKKTFTRLQNVKIHMALHEEVATKTPEIEFKTFKCDDCGVGFSEKLSLECHLKTHKRVFHCSVCKKKFYKRHSYELHMKVHSESSRFICTVCCKTFPSWSHLRLHMKTHTGEKPFVCSVCNSGYTKKLYLERHMKSHANQKIYSLFTLTGKPLIFLIKKTNGQTLSSLTKEVVGSIPGPDTSDLS